MSGDKGGERKESLSQYNMGRFEKGLILTNSYTVCVFIILYSNFVTGTV